MFSYTFVEVNRSCHVWAVIGFFGMLSSLFASSGQSGYLWLHEYILRYQIGLLTLRLVALYRRNKIMVWFIRTFFLASYLATLGLVISASATYNSWFFQWSLQSELINHPQIQCTIPICSRSAPRRQAQRPYRLSSMLPAPLNYLCSL